jgi:exodeoxyribonuclease V gamma subunit
LLHIHRAERADGLVEALGELLVEPLPDPLAPDVIAVPTRGMERWLTQRLSARLGVSPGRGDGVCANVEFPFPRRLVGGAVAAASGVNPEEDPWVPERALWTFLEVVEECLGEPWLHGLSAYLGGGPDADPARRAWRLSTVRHLAELYGRYALHRSELVRAWADGETDGGWQAELWLRLRERIGQARTLSITAASRTSGK